MENSSCASISNFASEKPIDEPVESSRIDDLILEQLNTLRQENIALKNEIRALRQDLKLDKDDIRDLYAAIASLEQIHLQPKQKDRREILLALITANGGKMFAKDARKKMGLKKSTFSVLLKSLKDEIDKKPYHLNKSQLVISLAKL